MRVIECAGFYFPDSVGGTEVYVNSLGKGLHAHGIESAVAAPSRSTKASRYVHEGLEVFRYPVPERWFRSEIQGRSPPRQFDVFEDWLREQRADVYHQHSWATGCGLWHLKAAKRVGMKTVVTMHVPGNVCMRGTMLYEGRLACDGQIVPEKCASCWLQSKGLPAGAARCMAKLPQGLGPLARLPRLGPALAANALAANHKNQLHEMALTADRIVAVCRWLQDALLVNGVQAGKLVLNRQGIGDGVKSRTSGRAINSSVTFRFGFLGRWDPIKGVDVLVEAFKCLPKSLAVELDICAVAAVGDAKKYRDEVQRSAVGDPRIRFLPEIPPGGVGAFLADLDALAVPSQWLETGPLVVLEAFAVGTPVIGSDLGGIKELVSHERDGLLVLHDDVSAWTAMMTRLATERGLLHRLRQGIGPVRTMSEVAVDMAALYRELIATDRYAA